MGAQKRYAAHIDRSEAEKVRAGRPAPVTLPQQAYGPQPIEWARPSERPAVWVWIQWPDGPAERTAAFATGWNDRVVIVELAGEGGTRSVVVWRSAVAHRQVAR